MNVHRGMPPAVAQHAACLFGCTKAGGRFATRRRQSPSKAPFRCIKRPCPPGQNGSGACIGRSRGAGSTRGEGGGLWSPLPSEPPPPPPPPPPPRAPPPPPPPLPKLGRGDGGNRSEAAIAGDTGNVRPPLWCCCCDPATGVRLRCACRAASLRPAPPPSPALCCCCGCGCGCCAGRGGMGDGDGGARPAPRDPPPCARAAARGCGCGDGAGMPPTGDTRGRMESGMGGGGSRGGGARGARGGCEEEDSGSPAAKATAARGGGSGGDRGGRGGGRRGDGGGGSGASARGGCGCGGGTDRGGAGGSCSLAATPAFGVALLAPAPPAARPPSSRDRSPRRRSTRVACRAWPPPPCCALGAALPASAARGGASGTLRHAESNAVGSLNSATPSDCSCSLVLGGTDVAAAAERSEAPMRVAAPQPRALPHERAGFSPASNGSSMQMDPAE